jgi:hypothetical protein
MNCIRKRFTAAAAMALAAAGAQADVLVSNLAQPQRAFSELTSQFWAAQSFVTDGGSHALLSIDAMLGSGARRGDDTELVAELHASGPGIIGSLLTSFSFGRHALGRARRHPAAARQRRDAGGRHHLLAGAGREARQPGRRIPGLVVCRRQRHTGPGSLGAFGYSTDGG